MEAFTPATPANAMDLETLKTLGINPEELGNRIVDQCVNTLLHSSGFDPEIEEEVYCASRFKREIESRIQKAVDEKISAFAEEHLIPRVGEMIESAEMRRTSNFGEPKGPPMTFKEYIAHRAEEYMLEKVDVNGKSGTAACGLPSAFNSRLEMLMWGYIHETLDSYARNVIADMNKVIAEKMKQVAFLDAVASGSVFPRAQAGA